MLACFGVSCSFSLRHPPPEPGTGDCGHRLRTHPVKTRISFPYKGLTINLFIGVCIPIAQQQQHHHQYRRHHHHHQHQHQHQVTTFEPITPETPPCYLFLFTCLHNAFMHVDMYIEFISTAPLRGSRLLHTCVEKESLACAD